MKDAKKIREVGESLGLKYIGIENKSRHYRVQFERPSDGQTYGVALHKSKDEMHKQHLMNNIKRLTRFAAGLNPF